MCENEDDCETVSFVTLCERVLMCAVVLCRESGVYMHSSFFLWTMSRIKYKLVTLPTLSYVDFVLCSPLPSRF